MEMEIIWSSIVLVVGEEEGEGEDGAALVVNKNML
jgi:hypothetical protein